jgi:hypothetical protein
LLSGGDSGRLTAPYQLGRHLGGAGATLTDPREHASAQQIIDGMKSLIQRAHARGIKIWDATLLPYKPINTDRVVTILEPMAVALFLTYRHTLYML